MLRLSCRRGYARFSCLRQANDAARRDPPTASQLQPGFKLHFRPCDTESYALIRVLLLPPSENKCLSASHFTSLGPETGSRRITYHNLSDQAAPPPPWRQDSRPSLHSPSYEQLPPPQRYYSHIPGPSNRISPRHPLRSPLPQLPHPPRRRNLRNSTLTELHMRKMRKPR